MTTSTATDRKAGLLLREWRERRRLSQLDLAHLAGTSTRHLSYVETGRSRPSRDMVLRLSEALEVPLAERNEILLGAGHAPAYDDARRDMVATQRLLETLDLALAAHDPWPALVIDGAFDVVATNNSVGVLLGLVDADLLDPPVNVVRVTLHPRGLSRHIANLAEWRAHLVRQLRRHVAASPSPDLEALLAEVSGYPVDPAEPSGPEGANFALALELDVDGRRMRLYSTVATFGTPLDVAASELAIETFLPADEQTRAWLTAAG